MTTTQIERLKLNNRPKSLFRPRFPTLAMLGLVGILASVTWAWSTGERTTLMFFHQLNAFQSSPPAWLKVPMPAGHQLLAPTVILLLLALLIMQLSPQPRRWSRTIVVGSLLLLTARYLLWRSLTTLNLADPLNGMFSLGLFFLEMVMLAQTTILLLLTLLTRDRRREADHYAIAVAEGTYQPAVDILIPTYNEPDFILRRTIMGCQALDYANKRIYLLDDTRRPEVRDLAAELGCEYISRRNNRHAKAGNLNHAIAKTNGDLIVVFDADFVPTRNFLTRTVGFFQDSQVALVQTPQSFYNFDPVARNLGLENVVTPDEEVFYRQLQPIRDGAGSVTCAGTSFVVRRSALEETGGFVIGSLSEDYFTGIKLSANGYRLVYLDEKLSAGLAADTMVDYATQRLRWARGTLQAFFIDANPLTIPGLSPIQRLAHLEGLLAWFSNLSRVGFLFIPLAYAFLRVIPVKASAAELIYFFLPYYLLNLCVFSWLNYRSRSALMSDVYTLVIALPLAITIIQSMLAPFSKGFSVTPKGTASDRFTYNWGLALPLLILALVTALSLYHNLDVWIEEGWKNLYSQDVKGLSLGWIWSAYNLFTLSIALLTLLNVPKPDHNEWFAIHRTAHLKLEQEPTSSTSHLWGITTMISEGGAEIALTQTEFPPLQDGQTMPVSLHLPEEKLALKGIATQTGTQNNLPTVRIQFQAVTLEQHRQLVELLFCRPGQWKRQNIPGELRSLWLMLRALLQPRILFNRNTDEIRAIAVANG